MNPRQLITLLVSLGVVAGGAVFLKNKQKDRTEKQPASEAGKELLPSFSEEGLESVTIKSGKNEVTLVKKDGTWGVKERDGYPVNREYLRELLMKTDDLTIVEGVALGKSQLGRLQLQAPGTEGATDTETGIQISFKKEGGADAGTLILGKNIEGATKEDAPQMPFGLSMGGTNGRWVQLASKTDTAYKVKEGFSSLQTELKSWLDKAFITTTGGLKSVEVKSDPADQSWKITREKEGADPVLADKKEGEEIDPEKVKGVGSAFSSVYFNDVATAADKEKAGLDASKKTATVSFFDGFTYTLKVGNKVDAANNDSDIYMSVAVSADIPKEFTPAPAPADEKEDAKKAREQKNEDDKKKFEIDKKAKEERLAKEKAFEGRTYIVSKFTLDWPTKERSYFKKEAGATAQPGGVPPAPTPPPAPGSGVLAPPMPVSPSPAPAGDKPKRIEAVTPPVSVEIPPQKPKDPSAPGLAAPKAPEAPKPEMPKTDAPKADAPKAPEAPKPADAPKVEAPKAPEAPKPADAPKVEAPKAPEAPKADAPKAPEAPKPAEEPKPAEGEKK